MQIAKREFIQSEKMVVIWLYMGPTKHIVTPLFAFTQKIFCSKGTLSAKRTSNYQVLTNHCVNRILESEIIIKHFLSISIL